MEKRENREKRNSKKKRNEKYISILPFFEKMNLWEMKRLYFFICEEKSKKENNSYEINGSDMESIVYFFYSSKKHFY
jgi:hypothetical protein